MYAQPREDLRPAIAASMGLHIAIVVAGLISWPHLSRPAKLGSTAVPVTVVNYAPTTDVRPAEQADKVEMAAAPEPAPTAVGPPAPPAPKPEPVKPPPSPTPPPPPAAAKPVPSPTPKPAPKLDLDALAATRPSPRIANAKQALDLDALAASTTAQARRPAGARSNAAPGPPRPETDFIARLAVGAAQGLSADEAGLLAAKLNRLWNPNCGVEGAANVVVRVEMKLSPQGTVTSARVLEQTGGQGAIVAAAAQRAISAVRRGEPYSELPGPRYPIWKEIVFNFNAKEACQNR